MFSKCNFYLSALKLKCGDVATEEQIWSSSSQLKELDDYTTELRKIHT